jgi:hypothetical protein
MFMKYRRFLNHAFAAALLTIPTLGIAQSDMTCHITPFTAPASSGLAALSTAVSVNRYGNAIGDDANGKPYIRYSNGEVKPLPIFPNGGGATVTKRNAAGVTVGFFGGGSFINSGSNPTIFNVPNVSGWEPEEWELLLLVAKAGVSEITRARSRARMRIVST